MDMLISPSLLSADFLQLGAEVEMLNNSAADWMHVDVMDGVFVPNISYGLPVLSAISRVAKKPLDVHLMIVDPNRYVEQFKEAGANILTVQYEACTHLHRTLEHIKSLGMMAGVALNPHTPVSMLEEVTQMLDLVLVMSVNPGFGGQKFIPQSIDKVSRMKELLLRKKSKALIEVDGGIGLLNAPLLQVAGADVLVAGNCIFSAENPAAMVDRMKQV
ncbi:MAG: ribulose-phosphate 3-epimerase [Prevotellaceae bacterium]|nr:ribulose-phosphate 3-epimerase [Prevotellaceae bacterium]